MKVRVLVENCTADPSLVSEHGLSLWIESGGENYLLDTGASGVLIENGARMGFDFSRLDGVVISHGHYDHTGGLERLLTEEPHLRVYLRKGANHPLAALRPGVPIKEIGMNPRLWERFSDRFVWIDDEVRLGERVVLLSVEQPDPEWVCRDSHLYMWNNGAWERDDFRHELLMLDLREESMVLFSSCSHNGILNMIRTAQQAFPTKTISHIVGGFHMKGPQGLDSLNCSEEFVLATAEALKKSGAQIYTGHCTGSKAYELMKPILGDRLHNLYTGMEIDLGA